MDAVDGGPPRQHEYNVVTNSRLAAAGGHFAFVLRGPAMATAAPQLCTDAPGFDRVSFHELFNADVLAFFRAHLIDR